RPGRERPALRPAGRGVVRQPAAARPAAAAGGGGGGHRLPGRGRRQRHDRRHRPGRRRPGPLSPARLLSPSAQSVCSARLLGPRAGPARETPRPARPRAPLSRAPAYGPGYEGRTGRRRRRWPRFAYVLAVKGDVIVATVRTATAHWEGPLATGKGSDSIDTSGRGDYVLVWLTRAA